MHSPSCYQRCGWRTGTRPGSRCRTPTSENHAAHGVIGAQAVDSWGGEVEGWRRWRGWVGSISARGSSLDPCQGLSDSP
jgi:hypothetical protein